MPDICLLYCFVSVNESTFAYMNMKQENVLLKHLGIKPSLRMNLVSLCHPAKIYLKVVQ